MGHTRIEERRAISGFRRLFEPVQALFCADLGPPSQKIHFPKQHLSRDIAASSQIRYIFKHLCAMAEKQLFKALTVFGIRQGIIVNGFCI